MEVEGPEVAEAQAVPISLSLLFHTGLKFLRVPHQQQDDRVESAVICSIPALESCSKQSVAGISPPTGPGSGAWAEVLWLSLHGTVNAPKCRIKPRDVNLNPHLFPSE